MIEAVTITIILIFEIKNKLVVRNIAIKEETKNVMFWYKKDTSKVKNILLQWILQNIYLRKSDVSENSKVYYGRFIRNGLHESIAILVQLLRVDEMYNILTSASQLLLVERWRWNWIIKVFAGACPWMSIRLLRASFIKRQASSCKRYSCRKRVWYCNIHDTGAR